MPRIRIGDKIEQQLQRSVLSYAFFRWESALVIAAAIVLIGLSLVDLPWFPGEWWHWLIFGLIGEALVILTTLRDDRAYKRVMDDMFHQEFDVRKLRAADLREKVSKALEYRKLIVEEIKGEDASVLNDHLGDVTDGLEDWIAQVYHLAQGLDAYGRDLVIARDLRTVPEELARYEKRLAQERDGPVREELKKTVALKQSQWDTLKNLRDTMAKAQLQLENSLSAMSTIYTQVVLLGAKDVDSGRAQRLQKDMAEQIRALEDIGATMDEIYQMSDQ